MEARIEQPLSRAIARRLADHRDDLLGPLGVELAVRHHEVVLRVDIPEYRSLVHSHDVSYVRTGRAVSVFRDWLWACYNTPAGKSAEVGEHGAGKDGI